MTLSRTSPLHSKWHQDDLLDASDSKKRERAKAHAIWPLWLCVAVAFGCRLVLVVCGVCGVCGVGVHGVVCVCCVCVLGAALVFMGFLMA